MTARTPVYIDSGKLHVFEDGDTLPPWLSPSSMAWENLTGVPTGIAQLSALTGPGYAKVDAAGAWSVQAAIPQSDVSGLATALAGLQPISARLTAIASLTDAAGWLHDDGSGNWALTTPTKSDVGLGSVENTALSTWAGSANLTTLGTVTSGTWHGTAITDSYIVSAAAWNAKEGGLGNPSTSGYLLSSTGAGVRSWVAPYSLPTATASVLGGVKVGTGLAISSGVLSVSYGTAAGTACVGNDSRLSDSRAPTAHALDGSLHTISGKTAGQALLATSASAFSFVSVSGDATLSGAGALTLASLLTAGSAGNATTVPTLTWDAKGRLTAVGSAAISIPHTQIGDWGTATSSFLTANQAITLKGAVTGSGTTSIATAFANTHLAGINQDLTTTSSPTFAGGGLTGSLYGLNEYCNLNGGSSTTYYYVGSLASSGNGAYYHLTVTIQGGDWTQAGGLVADFNVYNNSPRAVVSGMGTFRSAFVCYYNTATTNFDFYYKPTFSNWSAFGISSTLLTAGTVYKYSSTQLAAGNTTAPSGTLTAISTTNWMDQAVSTTSSPTFASATIGNGIYRAYAGVNPSRGSIYASGVAPGALNYVLVWEPNGNTSYLSGIVASYLCVNGAPVITATSSGASVTGNLTVSNNAAITGTLDLTASLYLRSDANVLNAAGNGWNTWLSRNNGSPIITATGGFVGNLTGTASNASALGDVAADYFVQGSNASRTQVLTGAVTSQSQLFKSGFYCGSQWTDAPVTSTWTHLIHCQYGNDGGSTNYWSFDIAANFGSAASPGSPESYYVRAIANGTSTGWRTLIHSANYPSFNNFTSGIVAGNAGMNTWAGGTYSWFGSSGLNNPATWSGFMQSSTETLIGALSGGSIYLAVAQTRVLTISGSLVSTTLPLTVAGLITANGGISGNLTGTASNASALGGVAADNFVQGSSASRTTKLTTTGTSQSLLFKSGFYDSTNWTDFGYSWVHIIHCAHSDDAGTSNRWSFDIAANFAGYIGNGEHYYVRTITYDKLLNWRELIHSANYPSFNNFTSGLTTTTLTTSGTFTPAVITPSDAITIDATYQGKMISTGRKVNLPTTGPFVGFWFYLSWYHDAYQGWGPPGAWVFRGVSTTGAVTDKFSGIVSWTGSEWVAG